MIKVEGKTKRELEFSGSIKRLISPPQESQDAKRSRTGIILAQTAGNLSITRPVMTPQSEGHGIGDEVSGHDETTKETSLKSLWKRNVEVNVRNRMDSGFTLITEQKSTDTKAENLITRLDVEVHQPSVQTTAHTAQDTTQERETDYNKRGITRTAVTSPNGDGDTVTSSDQEHVGGIVLDFVFDVFNVHQTFILQDKMLIQLRTSYLSCN